MGPRYRAPRNPTRSQTSSAKTVQTWHYILGKQLTTLNDINALRARGSVYCSSRVQVDASGTLAISGGVTAIELGSRPNALITERSEPSRLADITSGPRNCGNHHKGERAISHAAFP